MLGSRVLLLNPPVVNGIAYTRQGKCQEREEVLGTTKPPYTLALIAAILRDHGIAIRLVDLTAERKSTEWLIGQLTREGFRPTLVIYASSTPTHDVDAREAAKLKHAFGAPIITFGPQASTAPLPALTRAPDLDGLLVGEPEGGALALTKLESLAQGDTIPSLTFRRNGQIVPHRERGSYEGFLTMPFPAWDLLNLRHYKLPLHGKPYVLVETSRGCPHRCDFCAAHVYNGHEFRERDAKLVVDEIEEARRRFGIECFYMWGDTVTLNVKAFTRFCDELIARDLGVLWLGNGRADNLVKPEFVARLKQSGCWMLALGIESESDETRRDMLKHLEREKIKIAIDNLRAGGVRSFGFFIFGYPGDTRESIDRTAAYAREINPDYLNFYPAVPYPGTSMYDRCVRDGLLPDEDWARMDYSSYLLRGNGLDEAVVMNAIHTATRRFYLRPSWLLGHWRDIVRLIASSGPIVAQSLVRMFQRLDASARGKAAPAVPPVSGAYPGCRLPIAETRPPEP
jgi:anaerobic magnesium-protoporphyrin IX monomethyl ester cyclase